MRDLSEIPGCLKLFGIYENDSSVNLVIEYIKGGELVKKIQSKNKDQYTIEDARGLMKNILSTLSSIHQKNIIHRDLKPENILLEEDSNKTSIKIADFGLATYDSSIVSEFLFKKCGTPGFLAPEVLSSQEHQKLYDSKVDVFSAGVIFYILLCGSAPFRGTNAQQVVRSNKMGVIDFTDIDRNKQIPQAGKSLLKQMLSKDPKNRPSAFDCLNSLFFKEVYLNNELVLEFTSYDYLKQESQFGLNKIKLASTEKNSLQSSNEVYWINPIWKGQTNTLQTITKLSSTYLVMNENNEIRKRNKSNFAPNTQNADSEDPSLINSSIQVREKRSASADCDFRSKFQNSKSLHITVLKKNKFGDGEDSQGSYKSLSPLQFSKGSLSPNQSISHHFQFSSKDIIKRLYSKQDSFLAVSQICEYENQQGDMQGKISQDQSPTEGISKEDKRDSNLTLSTSSKKREQYSLYQEDKIILYPEEKKSQWNIPIEEEKSVMDESNVFLQTNMSGGSNLKISDAQENTCQIINQTIVRLKGLESFSKQKCISHLRIENKGGIFDGPEEITSVKILEINNINRLNKSLKLGTIISPRINSCLEADFRVSEVEENIHHHSSPHEAINRNLIFRYNPFDQDIYL